MSDPNGYVWWKNGWIRASVLATIIFLTGIGVGRGTQSRINSRPVDYRIGNKYWEITWNFKRNLPERSRNHELEGIALRHMGMNFALATMVASDSSANMIMLLKLIALSRIAFEYNMATADSIIKSDSIASMRRGGGETGLTR